MRAEALAYINRIEAALALVRQSLDWERALRRLDELNARVQDPNLWDNPKQAQAISREQKSLESAVNTVNEITAEMRDAVEFIEMGEAEGEDSIVEDGLATLSALAERADADKVQALLSGEADGNDTYLEIHAGAGGTESQDWAEMLLRMYARWAERRGFKVDTVEYQAGEQAGIKSATLLIKGDNAYGYAKTESGVHRARGGVHPGVFGHRAQAGLSQQLAGGCATEAGLKAGEGQQVLTFPRPIGVECDRLASYHPCPE